MKIRTDYVSNSSSSSFIFHLNKPIRYYSKEEFMKLFDSYVGLSIAFKKLQEKYGNCEDQELCLTVDYDSSCENRALALASQDNPNIITAEYL